MIGCGSLNKLTSSGQQNQSQGVGFAAVVHEWEVNQQLLEDQCFCPGQIICSWCPGHPGELESLGRSIVHTTALAVPGLGVQGAVTCEHRHLDHPSQNRQGWIGSGQHVADGVQWWLCRCGFPIPADLVERCPPGKFVAPASGQRKSTMLSFRLSTQPERFLWSFRVVLKWKQNGNRQVEKAKGKRRKALLNPCLSMS